MREPSASVRETAAPTAGASRIATLWANEWIRSYCIAVAMAAFLWFVGANGTAHMPTALRFGYWLTVMLLGTAIGQILGAVVERVARLNSWQEMAVLTVAMTPLITLMVWLVTAVFMNRGLNPAHLPYYFLPVLIISLVMSFLHVMVSRVPAQSHAYAEPRATEPAAAFRDRLAFKFRHADIYALSAEDHYLRVHTSAGETLILMRLYDAIRELDGIEGSQIHRSWWVAKDAVSDIQRNDGRVALTLKNGHVAPVSRSYVKALRQDGWLAPRRVG